MCSRTQTQVWYTSSDIAFIRPIRLHKVLHDLWPHRVTIETLPFSKHPWAHMGCSSAEDPNSHHMSSLLLADNDWNERKVVSLLHADWPSSLCAYVLDGSTLLRFVSLHYLVGSPFPHAILNLAWWVFILSLWLEECECLPWRRFFCPGCQESSQGSVTKRSMESQ